MRIQVQMFLFVLAISPAAGVHGADVDLPVDVVRQDIHTEKMFTVVDQHATTKGGALLIVIKPKEEKMAVDIDLADLKIRTAKIVIQGGASWKDVRFYPDFQRTKVFLNLLRTNGVSVDKESNDCVIRFNEKATRMLFPRGRLTYSKAYERGGAK